MITYGCMQNACIDDAIEDLIQIPEQLFRVIEMVDEISRAEYEALKQQRVREVMYLIDAVASNIEIVSKVLEPYYWVERPTSGDSENALSNED